MKQKYYFCFRFQTLTLEKTTQGNLEACSFFQIQVLKNHKSIGYTNPIACIVSPDGVVNLGNECISLTTTYQSAQPYKNACQIRLLEIISGGEREVGVYQFLLGNYIHASKNLLRSCIEMRVEIGQCFVLQYVVYVESTQQALQKIVQEHQTAKKLHMLDEQGSEVAEFLPEEIHNPKQQALVKVIQYDLSSPLIIQQRYFSPTKLRNKLSLVSNEEDPTTFVQSDRKKLCRSMQKEEKRKMGFLKMKKVRSNMSDNTSNQMMKSLKSKRQKKYSHIIEQEVQVLAQPDDTSRSNQKLYEVITSNSKISGSPAASERQINTNQNHVSSLQTPSEQISSKVQTKRRVLPQKIIFVLIAILVAVFIFSMRQTSKQKRMKFKRNKLSQKKPKIKRSHYDLY